MARTLRIVAVTLASAAACELHAQNAAVISGTVRNAISGVPVANATVSTAQGKRRYVTDGDGKYRLTIDARTSLMRVTAFGFAPDSQTIVLTAGASHVKDFALQPSVTQLDEVVTTGTRVEGRISTESTVPVDVISSRLLESTGAVETWQQLQRLVPSLNVPRLSFRDDGARPVTLRGLAPHHALVLVNGKRRHPAASLLGNTVTGVSNAGFTDLSAIPGSAIDHIDILRDGASAQYGSDAIGGVVNIVLKSGKRRDLRASVGQVFSSDGGRSLRDGRLVDVDGTAGMVARNGAYLTISGELRHRGETNRSYPDHRQLYFAGDPRNDDPPRITSALGDGATDDVNLFLTTAAPFRGAAEAYAFAGASYRNGLTWDAFRSAKAPNTVRSLFPDGFLPTIETGNGNLSGLAGIRGIGNGWRWDVSTGWGGNRVAYHSDNTNNPSMGAASPTHFYLGRVKAQQWTSNIDASRKLKIRSLPITLAGGGELRAEKYRIRAGDDASWSDGGVRILDGPQAGNPAPVGAEGKLGFRPDDEASVSRTSTALYLEADSRPLQRLLLQSAVRAEHYTDFGSTSDGKVAARFELARGAALRASVSTGFRAPALTQQYLSATNTVAGQVNGAFRVLFLHTFPVDSKVAKLMGATPLRPETSVNRSAGLVLNRPHLPILTLDYYQIDIDDRIGLVGRVTDSSFVRQWEANGFRGVTAGTYFRNNVDTRTRGVDVVASHAMLVNSSSVTRLFAGYNHNQSRVTHVAPRPRELEIDTDAARFTRTQRGMIEQGQPRQTITAGMEFTTDRLGLNIHNQRSGPTASLNMTDPDKDQHVRPKWITNIRASYRLQPRLEMAVSATNLFDVYPTENNTFEEDVKTGKDAGLSRYSGELSPFGVNGRTIYVHLSYR